MSLEQSSNNFSGISKVKRELTSYRLVITGAASPLLKEKLAAKNVKLTEFALPGPLKGS